MSDYEYNKKWRRDNPKKWAAMKKRNYAQSAGKDKNNNHKQEWALMDISLLESNLLSDRELHKIIGRSVQAIQIKRTRMKEKKEGGDKLGKETNTRG